MDNLIKILIEFEGILGAVLGSVTTLIATELLKSRGKIKLYLKDFQGVYETYYDVGCYQAGKTDDDFYGYKINYSFQVYNGTDIPRIMRDFKIIFYKDDNIVYSDTPKNEETRKNTQLLSYFDEMEILNIYPKEIKILRLSLYIWEDDLHKIEGATKIAMIFYNEKDKKKSLPLSSNKVSQKNYLPQR